MLPLQAINITDTQTKTLFQTYDLPVIMQELQIILQTNEKLLTLNHELLTITKNIHMIYSKQDKKDSDCVLHFSTLELAHHTGMSNEKYVIRAYLMKLLSNYKDQYSQEWTSLVRYDCLANILNDTCFLTILETAKNATKKTSESTLISSLWDALQDISAIQSTPITTQDIEHQIKAVTSKIEKTRTRLMSVKPDSIKLKKTNFILRDESFKRFKEMAQHLYQHDEQSESLNTVEEELLSVLDMLFSYDSDEIKNNLLLSKGIYFFDIFLQTTSFNSNYHNTESFYNVFICKMHQFLTSRLISLNEKSIFYNQYKQLVRCITNKQNKKQLKLKVKYSLFTINNAELQNVVILSKKAKSHQNFRTQLKNKILSGKIKNDQQITTKKQTNQYESGLLDLWAIEALQKLFSEFKTIDNNQFNRLFDTLYEQLKHINMSIGFITFRYQLNKRISFSGMQIQDLKLHEVLAPLAYVHYNTDHVILLLISALAKMEKNKDNSPELSQELNILANKLAVEIGLTSEPCTLNINDEPIAHLLKQNITTANQFMALIGSDAHISHTLLSTLPYNNNTVHIQYFTTALSEYIFDHDEGSTFLFHMPKLIIALNNQLTIKLDDLDHLDTQTDKIKALLFNFFTLKNDHLSALTTLARFFTPITNSLGSHLLSIASHFHNVDLLTLSENIILKPDIQLIRQFFPRKYSDWETAAVSLTPEPNNNRSKYTLESEAYHAIEANTSCCNVSE
ncbi:MAG: hypothetical protein HAW62_06895 [Endozoicomonadaceae bacterium]|nr:hypothetical protein [Endozoicomonadaceae bacterium]